MESIRAAASRRAGSCVLAPVHAAGESLWAVELAAAVFSPVTACQPARGHLQVLLGTESGQLHSLDARSGEVRWRAQLSGPADNCAPDTAGMSTGAAPAVSSERAFEGAGERCGESVAWDTTSCAGPGRAAGSAGSGACLQQSEQPSGRGPDAHGGVQHPPGPAAGQVWSCTNDGDLVLASHDSGVPAVMMAEARLGSPIFSSPVAFDDVVVFGCRDDHLYCVSSSQKAAD